MNWASGYIRSSQNSALKSFSLYMPNPLPGTGVFTEFSTGFNVKFKVGGKRKDVPVKMIFGAPSGAYGQLMGLGMEMGVRRQLYRMDVHPWHGNRGGGTGVKQKNEIDSWIDPENSDYHYHVIKWTQG